MLPLRLISLRFWGIFWIDGRSKSSITQGFAAIARKCGHQDESLEGVTLWLQNTSHSWLLVLDNADNKDLDMAQFLPAGRNGSILITTRLTECARHQTVGKDRYERLNDNTAIDLLLKASDIESSSRSEHKDYAREVAELLGCHALAIIQAGAAVSQGLCNLKDYKKLFENQGRELLECFPEQARSDYGGVYATFEVTAKYLEDRDDQTTKDALELLSFYAFMHFSDFPEITFEKAWKNSTDDTVVSSELNADGEEDIHILAPWHVSHLPGFMESNAHDVELDQLRLRKARSLLTSLSLVTFDSGMTRMHPVSHFWSRDRLREPEKSTKARLNGLAVLSLSISNPYAIDPLPLSGQLHSHIESFAHSLKEWDCPQRDFHLQQSVYSLSYVMYRLHSHSALLELLHLIPIQTDKSWLKTENGQKIQSLHGFFLLRDGESKEAVLVLEQLNEAQTQTLAAEDPKVLQSQRELARAYLEVDDTTKAIEMLEQVLHTPSKSLSPEDESLLSSQHELASAYMKIGNTNKALPLLEQIVEIRTKKLRSEHPNRLTSQHELARAYLEIGELDKAISLLEEVVEIKARTLKENHPDRVVSIRVLAQSHYRARNYERALELARSIEKVVQNRGRQKSADWNAKLIGNILKKMKNMNIEERI